MKLEGRMIRYNDGELSGIGEFIGITIENENPAFILLLKEGSFICPWVEDCKLIE